MPFASLVCLVPVSRFCWHALIVYCGYLQEAVAGGVLDDKKHERKHMPQPLNEEQGRQGHSQGHSQGQGHGKKHFEEQSIKQFHSAPPFAVDKEAHDDAPKRAHKKSEQVCSIIASSLRVDITGY